MNDTIENISLDKGKLSNYMLPMTKGIVAGLLLSCINNLWIIVSLYDNLSYFINYSMVIPSAVVTYFFLNNKKFKYFMITWIISILSFVLVDILISNTGIVPMVYKHINGYSAEMSAGDGFGMMVIYMYNFFGSIIGVFIAFVASCIKENKKNY